MGKGFHNLKEKVMDQLAELKAIDQLRSVSSVLYNHHDYMDLTHNDYLNLRNDQQFLRAIQQIPENLSAGCGASRLLGGEHPSFQELESLFASYKGSESALYFTSGYAANEALGSVFSKLNAHIFSDSLNHASIIDGIKLGRYKTGKKFIFPHNNISHLSDLLKNSTAEINIIYIESLYSMDGDYAKIEEIYNLCESHRGVLVIDEAHATGCYGIDGKGLIDEFNIPHDNVISISTMGKALGCQGAFINCPSWFRDYLINTSRPFIYSTGPSPILMACLKISLDYVKTLDQRRKHLHKISEKLRRLLQKNSFDIGNSKSHIIPIILQTNQKALTYANQLKDYKILTKAIRPPTVPENMARLRISLHGGLQESDINKLVNALKDINDNES